MLRLKSDTSGTLRLHLLWFAWPLMKGPTAGATGVRVQAQDQWGCKAEDRTESFAEQEEQDVSEVTFP